MTSYDMSYNAILLPEIFQVKSKFLLKVTG
jgi:hypothetical protein